MSEIDLGPLIAALAELFPDIGTYDGARCDSCPSIDVVCKGKCKPCYDRWWRAGFPEHVPPRQRRRRRCPRRVLFAEVRSLGATVPQAARNAGLAEHTGWRLDGAA